MRRNTDIPVQTAAHGSEIQVVPAQLAGLHSTENMRKEQSKQASKQVL